MHRSYTSPQREAEWEGDVAAAVRAAAGNRRGVAPPLRLTLKLRVELDEDEDEDTTLVGGCYMLGLRAPPGPILIV